MASDGEGMTAALSAIANPVRRAILRELRVPKTAGEIRVAPGPSRAASSPERPLARQSVEEHVAKLLAAGLVHTIETPRERSDVVQYVVNQQAVFALAEEVRELARLRPFPEISADTIERPGAPTPSELAGPCVVLVHGVDPGRVFRLETRTEGAAAWTIGRSRGADVALDFDPFASAENCVVRRVGDEFLVEDASGSRNGTSLNFRRLPRGAGHRLATGDLIGVGRSLLMFRR